MQRAIRDGDSETIFGAFKAEVALEAIQDHQTWALATKYEVHPTAAWQRAPDTARPTSSTRPGQPVHQFRLHQHSEVCRHPHLDGRPRPLDGQRLHARLWRSLKCECVFIHAFEREAKHERASVAGSAITTPIGRTRPSAAGRPMRSTLNRLARSNWSRNRTQNPS